MFNWLKKLLAKRRVEKLQEEEKEKTREMDDIDRENLERFNNLLEGFDEGLGEDTIKESKPSLMQGVRLYRKDYVVGDTNTEFSVKYKPSRAYNTETLIFEVKDPSKPLGVDKYSETRVYGSFSDIKKLGEVYRKEIAKDFPDYTMKEYKSEKEVDMERYEIEPGKRLKEKGIVSDVIVIERTLKGADNRTRKEKRYMHGKGEIRLWINDNGEVGCELYNNKYDISPIEDSVERNKIVKYLDKTLRGEVKGELKELETYYEID